MNVQAGKLWSINEISESLGIKPDVARNMARRFSEYIPSQKVGKQTRYGIDGIDVIQKIHRMLNAGSSDEEIALTLRMNWVFHPTVTVSCEDCGEPTAFGDLFFDLGMYLCRSCKARRGHPEDDPSPFVDEVSNAERIEDLRYWQTYVSRMFGPRPGAKRRR